MPTTTPSPNFSNQDTANLPDLKAEDILKLHNEVNQYINQRFFIVTTAITITGIVLGWITKDPLVSPDSKAFFITLSLLIILGALYATSQIINRSMSVITSYLRIKKLSAWEMIYNKLMRAKSSKIKWAGQNESLKIVFGILGFLAGSIPFILAWITPSNLTPFELILGHGGVNRETMLGAVLLFIATLLYEIFIVFGIGSMIVGVIIFLLVHSLSIFIIPLSLETTTLLNGVLFLISVTLLKFRQKRDINEESTTMWLELAKCIKSHGQSESGARVTQFSSSPGVADGIACSCCRNSAKS